MGEGLGPLKKLIRFDTKVILVAFFRTVSYVVQGLVKLPEHVPRVKLSPVNV